MNTLYESLSHCASQYPSLPGGADAHPLAGLAAMSGEASSEEEKSDEGRVRSGFQSPDVRYRPY